MPFNKLNSLDTDKPRKILYIINHIDWFWSHRYALAKDVQQTGCKVFVATSNARRDSSLSREGFIPLDLPEYGAGASPVSMFRTILQIRKHIRKVQPDLVHGITIKYAFMTGLATLFQNVNTKKLFTIAGLGYVFSGSTIKSELLRLSIMPFMKLAFFRKNTKLIFQNSDDQKIFNKAGLCRMEDSNLIPGSGVSIRKFVFSHEPETMEPVVFMPTRLVREKGVAVFAEAAKIVSDKGYKARFILGGGLDKYNPNALSETEMNKILSDTPVTWRGKIKDMPRMFRRANMIVYPSYYKEGVPKVLLEAAASGRAIITTDHPGCRDVVENGKNGLLVPVKDAQATANAIIDLLKAPEMRKVMGRHSREKAVSEFDVHLINQKTLKIYEDQLTEDLSSQTLVSA